MMRNFAWEGKGSGSLELTGTLVVCLNFGRVAKDMHVQWNKNSFVGGDRAEKQAPEVGASMGPRNVNFCLRFGGREAEVP